MAEFFAALLLVVLVSLWTRLPTLALLDLFLLSIALFFGAYTLIDAFTVEPTSDDPIIVGTVFMLVSLGTLVLWWFARRPPAVFAHTSLARLRRDWSSASGWAVVALIGIAIWNRWYTAELLGDLPLGTNPETVEADLPYWYTSLSMIGLASVYPAGLCAWGKAMSSAGLRRLFWFAAMAASLLVILGSGRRAVFAFLVIVGWDVLTRIRGRRWLAVMLLAMSVPAFITVSNLFQAYRTISYRGVPLESVLGEADVQSLAEGAAALDKTVSNLQERPAMWRFNYEVVKANLEDRGDLMLGHLFIGSIQNFIPAAIYPDKVIVDPELVVLERFGLDKFDRPENIFVNTYADFGLLSALVAPAMILFFVWVCALVLRRLRDPFLRATLMGMAIFYALNLEASYHVPIGLAREFALIAIAYIAILTACRVARAALREASSAHS